MAKQPDRPFSIELNDFKTVNTKDSPVTMKDDELSILLNFMPIGTSLKVVPGYSAILASLPEGVTVLRQFNAVISGNVYTLIATTDGALYCADSSWVVTQIKAAGTFTNPRFTQWKTTDVLIIDASGYYSFSPSNGTEASAGIGYASGYLQVKFANAIDYTLAGVPYTKAAQDPFWDLTGFNCAMAKKNYCYLYIDAAGAASIAPWTADRYAPIAPAIDLTKCLVGTILVDSRSYIGGFVGGTTNFLVFLGGAGTVAFGDNVGGTSPGVSKHTASNAPTAGTCIAVFGTRVWVANGRTLYYSAPDSFTDWTTANAGGSTTDDYPDLYSGITGLLSTQDYLYIVGDHATHVLTGIQVYSTGNTGFEVIDALPGIGSLYPDTILAYGGVIFMMGDAGIHAVSASSYELLSSYLDGIMPRIDTAFSPVASFLKIYNKTVYAVLVKLTSPIDGTSQKWLMCLYEGRWFFIYYPLALVAIMQRPSATDTLAYAAYGNNIIQILTGSSELQKKFRTKAHTFAYPIHDKKILKVGAQLSSDAAIADPVSATMTVFGTGSDDATVEFDLSGVTSPFDNVFGAQGIEGAGRGKRIQIDYDETSAAVYTLSGIMVEGILSAEW